MHLRNILNCTKLLYKPTLGTLFRSSSKFQRPRLNVKSDQLADIKATYFYNRSDLSTAEWTNIKELLEKNYRHINQQNVDAVIVGLCNDAQQLSLAKNYIKHLKESGKEPNDATWGKLLRIYNSVYHKKGANEDSLTPAEQNEILEIYEKIHSKHEVLDSLSCENLLYGLVATAKWKSGLQLMEMMKVTTSPTLPAYTEMAIKAFSMHEIDLGWTLLHQMLEHRKQPKCEIFLTYLNVIAENPATLSTEFEKLLKFLQLYDVVISENVVNAMRELSLKYSDMFTVQLTKLKRFGQCSSCDLHLENVSIADEDFVKLRDTFLNKVLIGNDVFQKSTPAEVKRFRDYVSRTGPYDCVIDGLNVAYSMGSKKPPQVYGRLLSSVVKYFKNRNKHVLVLGRQHMNKWPKPAMQYVKENAAMFLANDLSQDDPFMLYATLKSGPTTDIFSRDFMRQHAFLLGPDLKAIFKRWQQEHQYSLITQTESGKIIVKEPIRHLICAHKVNDTWHVPYKQVYEQQVSDCFEIPEYWLCIKIKNN